MKKLLFLMMALLVAPAMAAVTISLEPVGECSVDIVVTADSADTVDGADVYSLVAGIALNVSVSPGQIDSVTGFMTAGVSTAADRGCGIYMGTITFTGGEPEAILDVGTPVAPITAPDAPGPIPGPACVLELGCLFDVGVPADASLARTVLCTLNLSETTTVTVTEEIATRGGIVLIGGDPPSDTVLPPPTLVDCLPCYAGQPDYLEWEAVLKPDSWCRKYQCRGDMNGTIDVIGTLPFPPFESYGPVGVADLGLFLAAYKVENGDASENLAADLNHSEDVIGTLPFPPFEAYGRTGSVDLQLFLANYKVETDQVAICGTPPLEN